MSNSETARPANRVASTMFRGSITLLGLALLGGCASFAPTDSAALIHSRAGTPVATQTLSELRELPTPAGVITAAVYSFRDLTGQYKPAPSNNLSTAVTQGADAILLKALLDSGWFAPVERSSLQHLLTERKIVQSSTLESNRDNPPPALPPVKPAQILFEGSIVSYDTNIHSGGSGLRFLGVGGSQTYREDRVVVNLRVINIENGAVIHSVNSAKRLFSRTVDGGIFAYVDADEILESEAGYGYNEPSHVAISEAIESALIHVIAEGIVRNSWQLADAAGIRNPAFDRFLPSDLRDRFLALKREEAAAFAERRRVDESVRKRMQAGLRGLERYRLERERRLLSKLDPAGSGGAAGVDVPLSAEEVSSRAQALLRSRAERPPGSGGTDRETTLRVQRLLLEKQAEQARRADAGDRSRPIADPPLESYRPVVPTTHSNTVDPRTAVPADPTTVAAQPARDRSADRDAREPVADETR